MRNSPPIRATVVLGPTYGTSFTYNLGDASKPYLGYPVDPALKVGLDERNGVKSARVNVQTVDPNLRSPYVHNWFLGVQRELVSGIVVDVNYPGVRRPRTRITSTGIRATCSTAASTGSIRASTTSSR
jgi:hypothetical protein